jgi:hypothetical protein
MRPSNSLDARFFKDLTTMVLPSLGITLEEEFHDRLSQRRFGDGVFVSSTEGRRLIDWKASQVEQASFPVELLQDWPSNDLGWFYTLQCDEVYFGHYVIDRLNTVDAINLSRLRQLPSSAFNGLRPQLSDKGQGHTIFVPIQLAMLRREGVASCVWDRRPVQAEVF